MPENKCLCIVILDTKAFIKDQLHTNSFWDQSTNHGISNSCMFYVTFLSPTSAMLYTWFIIEKIWRNKSKLNGVSNQKAEEPQAESGTNMSSELGISYRLLSRSSGSLMFITSFKLYIFMVNSDKAFHNKWLRLIHNQQK